MLAFNLKQDLFIDTSEVELNNDEFIILAYCGKSEKLVLTYIENNFDICLHNEDGNYDEIAVKLFKQNDRKFKLYLDFFETEDTFS